MGFFFLSLFLLVFGLARNELLSSLLGVSLVLVSLYSYAAALILEAVYRRRELSPTATPAATPRYPGDSGSLTLSLPAVQSPLPGILARWRLDFRFRSRRILLEAPAGGGGRARWEFTAPKRGLYEARGPGLVFGDPFGFARTEVDLGDSVELVVPPGRGDEGGVRPASTGSAHHRRQGRSLRRNELLIESRPYHPGDDLRRLNWKALARTDELLVRIGEEIPPERRRVTVICDPGGCADRVATATAALLEELASEGFSCTLLHGESGVAVNGDDPRKRERFLASLWEVSGEPAAGVTLGRLPSAILVTPRPGSAREGREIERLLSRGSLRLQSVECEEGSEKKEPLWQRLLFLPEKGT